MRDPKRISRIIRKLETVWLHQPDLRLTQLSTSVARTADWDNDDLFYLEDNDFERALDIILQNIAKEISLFTQRMQKDLGSKK